MTEKNDKKWKIEQMDVFLDYVMEQTQHLLRINSPSGYTKEVAQYVLAQYQALGYQPIVTNKGGILVALNEEKEEGILYEAHIDTLGGIVCEVKSNGNLKISPIGGMNPNNGEGENCTIITRNGKDYSGTLQLENASVHVNGEYDVKKREFSSMEIVIDEEVCTDKETRALGIENGDIVAFDPRTKITESGFIKSRFLDDKLCVGILLGYAKYFKEASISSTKTIYQYITVFEEVGHGGSASIPPCVKEIIAVDMGCVGDGLIGKETMVSICAKDSRGPYHYDVVSKLIKAAKLRDLNFAVDVYPFYGSDADAALMSGHDIRHGLIGPGVYASHGYERSHKKGILSTLSLIDAYNLLEGDKE